jgi:hypothetical protein
MAAGEGPIDHPADSGGDMTAGPVFVAGLERTGTSLMYALLASHPHIAMTRRTNFWRYFADQYGDLGDDDNLDACLAKMRVYKRLVKLELDHQQLREDFREGDRTYGRLFALLEEQVAARAGKPRWGDKSLNTERYADRLMAEYPDARMIHMIRDPRDRLASVLTRWDGRRGDVGGGTAAWLWSSRLAWRNAERHPERYRIVRYESLVHDPEAELRAICEFIDEPYTDEMLTMGGARRFRDSGSNSSYGARASGTIATDSIRKYESVLTPRQVAFVQVAAAREMEQHGYESRPVAMGRAEHLWFKLAHRPYHSGVSVLWQVREAFRSRRGRRLPDYRLVPEPA